MQFLSWEILDDMQSEFQIPIGLLISFLLVLTRVSGIFVFVPLPGVQDIANPARIALSMGVSIALMPMWPKLGSNIPDIPLLIGWIVMEAAFGVAVGIMVATLSEIFQFGAQMLSLQAGLAFASTFNPSSNADSTVLVTMAQLLAGSLFFATGLDRIVLVSFAKSLIAFPPGGFEISATMAAKIIPIGSTIFATGMLTVLPVIAFLLMVDLALGMLGRLNAQLQLLTLALPLKLMSTMVLIAWLMLLMPRIYDHAGEVLTSQLSALLKQ